MKEYNTKLMEALVSGGNVDEIFRQEIENAVNRLLETELTAFLGYERYSVEGYNTGDSRNGCYTRTIHSRYGDIQVKIPRDRNGQFKQQTVPAYGRNTDSLEEMVILLYRKGITTMEIADLVEKMYGHHYSKGTVSNITASIQAEVEAFHKRRLEKRYVVIYADATYLNVRRDCVDKEALHVLLGITPEGKKEILSYALYPTEGAEHYQEMLADIKARGAEQVLLFVSDGLTGFRDACKSVYPKADHQSCWVHICRNIVKLIRVKDRREVLDFLKTVYGADDAAKAEAALDAFCEEYGKRYPKLVQRFSDRRSLFSFFKYPKEIRQSLYTTNLVENMNKQLKRKTKRKEQFPTEEALDRCAYCHFSEENARFSSKTHRGFGLCGCAIEKLFAARYPASVAKTDEAAPAA